MKPLTHPSETKKALNPFRNLSKNPTSQTPAAQKPESQSLVSELNSLTLKSSTSEIPQSPPRPGVPPNSVCTATPHQAQPSAQKSLEEQRFEYLESQTRAQAIKAPTQALSSASLAVNPSQSSPKGSPKHTNPFLKSKRHPLTPFKSSNPSISNLARSSEYKAKSVKTKKVREESEERGNRWFPQKISDDIVRSKSKGKCKGDF